MSCVWTSRVLWWFGLLGLLVGFGGVVSPRPSWCGFQVTRVVFVACRCLLSSLLIGVLYFVCWFGVLCSFWGLVGASPAPSMGLRAFCFVVFCGWVAWQLFCLLCTLVLLSFFIYIHIFAIQKKKQYNRILQYSRHK